MHDILFTIPGLDIPIHSYGVMAMFGVIAAMLVGRWRARRTGIAPDFVTDLLLWGLLAGFVGSRVFYIAQNMDHFFGPSGSFIDIFKVWEGGLVFYGGFIGAFIAILVLIRRKKQRTLAVLDVLAPSVVLGHAFGRVGCFLKGCCYGIPLSEGAVCGIVFPDKADAYSPFVLNPVAVGTPLFPSQIASSLDLLAIFAILMLFFKHRRAEGQVTGLYLLLYSIHRFVIEIFRADTHVAGQLSPAQWISFVTFFFGLALMVYVHGSGTPVKVPAPEPKPANKPKGRKKARKGKKN